MRVISLIFFCLSLGFVTAQNDTTKKIVRTPKPCEIKLTDGSSYKGYIERQTDSLIFLKGSSGVMMQIPKKNVSEIDFIKENGPRDSVNFTHLHVPLSVGKRYYVTGSNAFLLKKKEIFISSSYLLFYNINYSFNQHFALGISTSAIGAPIGIKVKANYEIGHKLYLGMEGVAGGMMYLNPQTYGTGGVLKLTFGDENKNYTFFAGYADLELWIPSRRGSRRRPPVVANYYQRYSTPFAGVAAALPLTQKACFTAEAFAFPSVAVYTGSAAIRTIAWKKMSFVFGIQIIGNASVNVNKAFTLPYVGFSACF
ncbi:MAG TPA: hypothetical protein VNZ49_11080 [Bacteroidia bacterium]|nr:hypothetical protein [Bacteroidia bacterium]